MPVYKLVDDFNENYLEVVFINLLKKKMNLVSFLNIQILLDFSGSTGLPNGF